MVSYFQSVAINFVFLCGTLGFGFIFGREYEKREQMKKVILKYENGRRIK